MFMFTTKKLAELKKCLSKRDRLSDTDQRMFHSITTNSSKAPLLRGFATTFSPGIASAICTIFSKFFSFCTRLQNHPILSTPTTPDNSLNVLDYRDSSRIHILLLSDSKTILNKMQVYLFSFLFVLSFYHTLFCHTLFTAALYHKLTVLSESLQYLHSCKQTFSLFLPVHMLHPGSDTHKMHVEMCWSSAKTDIL